MTAEFSVVFDVSRDIYTSWMLSLVPLSYSIAWGILGWRLGDDPTKRRIAMYATLATGLIAGLIFSVGWTDYFRMRGAMARGEYRAVVGMSKIFMAILFWGNRLKHFRSMVTTFRFEESGLRQAFITRRVKEVQTSLASVFEFSSPIDARYFGSVRVKRPALTATLILALDGRGGRERSSRTEWVAARSCENGAVTHSVIGLRPLTARPSRASIGASLRRHRRLAFLIRSARAPASIPSP